MNLPVAISETEEDTSTDLLKEVNLRIAQARQSGEVDTELAQALSRADRSITLREGNGPWLMEGFISFFLSLRDIVAAIDTTFPAGLPPHLLDPSTISWFFGIPIEEINVGQLWNSSPLNGQVERLKTIADRFERSLPTNVDSEMMLDPKSPNLPVGSINRAEANILEALGNDTLTGEALTKLAGYPCNSAFKALLAGLVRRGLLENLRPGYRITKCGQDMVRTANKGNTD
jgi:hypothetical protein